MKYVALLLFFAAVNFAHAQPLDSAPKENYKNPKDTKGLCIEENDESWPSKRGYCKAMEEQMTVPGCASDLVEEIRQRLLAKPPKQGQEMDWGNATCKTNDGKEIDELAKNKDAFHFLLMQIFSIAAIEESDWNDAANKGSAKEGLLGLSSSDMKKKEYACGCDSKKQEALNPPDRAIDGHQNMICGMYMALYNAKKDGQIWGSGRPPEPKPGDPSPPPPPKPGKDDPNDTRRGFSRIFKSFEMYKDDNDKAGKERYERMQAKLTNFCKSHSSKSITTKWKRTMEDIGAESLGNSSKGAAPATR